MIFLSGLVGALLVLTAEARVGNSSESKYCSETAECLLYDLVCKTDTYEARYYSSVKWVSTQETAYAMEFAVSNAFQRLFQYISGENEEGMKIKMTAPVVTKMPDKTSFWQKRVYTMSFLLPSEQQKNPPMPTDDKVFIDEWPEMNVYVQGYGGWMSSLADKIKYNSLSSALNTAGEKYTKDYHYAVGYNSPMKWFNRHNEVWLIAVDEPECSSSEELDFSFPFFD